MTFDDILAGLPPAPISPWRIWTNGDAILCETEEEANAIADLIDSMRIGEAITGYYDPDEDERNNEVDSCTGYYYVSC